MNGEAKAVGATLPKTRNVRLALAAAAGLLVVFGLIAYQGFVQVGGILQSAGWGLGLVCLLHLPPLFFSSLAWQVLLKRHWPGTIRLFVAMRWIREALNTLLPVTQIGGEVVSARLLTFCGVSAGLAGGSVVVDLTLEILAQFVFTVLGLAFLAKSGHDNGTVRILAIGLAAGLPLLLGFVLAQRWGLFGVLERLLRWVAEKRPALGLAGVTGLHDAIQELYRDPWRLIRSGSLHLTSWLLTSAEVWLALRLMGHSVSFQVALVLLSLGHAIRSAAFLIPSGWGVQEAGFMALGAMYGLSPDVGLALSLAIRLREVVLGLPALILWPLVEGKRTLAGC